MTTNYVKSWFARGDDDLALTKLILEKGNSSPNLACFHAQQAAEKYLKGFLAHRDLHVRKVHDLEVLLGNCKNIDPSFASLQDSARFLSQFYVKSRYPDDYAEFSREDAEKAFEAALRIKDFVLSRINPLENKSGFSLIGLIIVAAIIAAAGIGGGFYFKESKNQQNLIELGKQREKEAEALKEKILQRQRQQLEEIGEKPETQQPSQTDMTSWKTYRNEKYGFEFDYPVPTDFVINTDQISKTMDSAHTIGLAFIEFDHFNSFLLDGAFSETLKYDQAKRQWQVQVYGGGSGVKAYCPSARTTAHQKVPYYQIGDFRTGRDWDFAYVTTKGIIVLSELDGAIPDGVNPAEVRFDNPRDVISATCNAGK